MGGGKEQRRSVDASLLRAVVDQFVERSMHPPADIRQFEPLALGLIDNIDSETVARVALPLCFHPETPSSIFTRLFDKGGAAAALAFQFTPNFRQREMMATAERGPAPFAAAIARRRDLDRETMTALASRSEVEVLRALAGNLSAHLDTASRRALVVAARDDLTLARMLLDRDDLDLDPEPLFLAANRLERRAIVLHACRQILANGATEAPCRANADFVAKLEGAAQRHDRHAMAALLSEALECRKDRARAVVADRLGEAFALALKALGIPLESAARILWVEPQRSATIARSLVGLTRSTPQRAAARIVGAMTGAARSERENSRRATREEAGAPTWRRAAAPQPVARPSRKLDQSA